VKVVNGNKTPSTPTVNNQEAKYAAVKSVPCVEYTTMIILKAAMKYNCSNTTPLPPPPTYNKSENIHSCTDAKIIVKNPMWCTCLTNEWVMLKFNEKLFAQKAFSALH